MALANSKRRSSAEPSINRLRLVSAMKSKTIFAAAAAACFFVCGLARAQEASPAATTPSDSDGVSVELNKLEKSDKGCRAYVVVTNPTSTSYDAFKLDLVLFQTDGVVGRRLALDLAPVRPDKKSVKLFDLEGTECDQIGSFLVNDVIECRAGTGEANDCLARLKVKSLTKAQFSK
jgi:hypothetical protein